MANLSHLRDQGPHYQITNQFLSKIKEKIKSLASKQAS